jgi:hypothetical protein
MATGDVDDFIKRLKHVLPPWFGEDFELLDRFLKGFATLDAFIFSVFEYVNNQMVIQTSTDNNLDLEACDYFGAFLTRPVGMPDEEFKRLMLASLLAEMCTVKGIKAIIKTLTGHEPDIFEPFGTGAVGYNVPIWGYNIGGAYSGSFPYEFWITVYVDGDPMDVYAGYNGIESGYSVAGGNAKGAYGSTTLFQYTYTFDEILALINRIKVGGTLPHLTVIYL